MTACFNKGFQPGRTSPRPSTKGEREIAFRIIELSGPMPDVKRHLAYLGTLTPPMLEERLRVLEDESKRASNDASFFSRAKWGVNPEVNGNQKIGTAVENAGGTPALLGIDRMQACELLEQNGA